MYTFPCGRYDRKHHTRWAAPFLRHGTEDLPPLTTLPWDSRRTMRAGSDLHAAQCELSEEARLTGGEWVRLLPAGHPGVSELKWSTNRFLPWLVLDPVLDAAPLPRDDDGAKRWPTADVR